MGYRIKTVSDLTGVPRNTLLAWERRYGVVEPERQDNGYREYSDADVAVLQEVKRLVDQGHKVSEAISLLDQARRRPPPPANRVVPHDVMAGLGNELEEALLRYDRHTADRIVQRLTAYPYHQLINELYFPVLRRVGDAWEAGNLSIPQEHYVSQFVREQLVAMLLTVQSGPSTGAHTICAGFPKDRHDLAILGISVQLALQGRRVTLLGADVPLEDISRLVASQAPDMVCISVMEPRTTDEIDAYAQGLREAAPAATRVVIGGSGLPSELPEIKGAEIYRDARKLLGS